MANLKISVETSSEVCHLEALQAVTHSAETPLTKCLDPLRAAILCLEAKTLEVVNSQVLTKVTSQVLVARVTLEARTFLKVQVVHSLVEWEVRVQ